MRFVAVPQWQGSPSPRAMRLSEGANAIFGDLPSKSSSMVEVPVGAGDGLGTSIHRLSSIAAVQRGLTEVLRVSPEVALVVGGDCAVEYGAIRHALRADTCVVWFDAHPDLNSPDESESGAFSGMVLGALLGRADDEFRAAGLPLAGQGESGDQGQSAAQGAGSGEDSPALTPGRVVLVGARSYDDSEDAYVEASGIATVSALDLEPAEVVDVVAATGATSIYVHVDLDVIDPAEFTGLLDPQPFGLEPSALVQTITALRERFELVGAGICSFAPETPAAAADDMGTILRVVGALAR